MTVMFNGEVVTKSNPDKRGFVERDGIRYQILGCLSCGNAFERVSVQGRAPFYGPCCSDNGTVVRSRPVATVTPIKPEPVKVNGDEVLRHRDYAKLLRILKANGQPLLSGGAGGGKSTIAGQLAEELGATLFVVSGHELVMASDLLGFVSVTEGTFVPGAIAEWLMHDGPALLLIDEIDAMNSSALIAANYVSAIEQGSSTPIILPGGKRITRGADKWLMGGANTDGMGATGAYSARETLDFATLDRFDYWRFEYDEVLERRLCQRITGTTEWAERVIAVRKAVERAGMAEKFLITPRATIQGAKMLKAGFAQAEVESMRLFKSMPRDVRRSIEALIAA